MTAETAGLIDEFKERAETSRAIVPYLNPLEAAAARGAAGAYTEAARLLSAALSLGGGDGEG